jgi:hypothetical protein
MQTKHILQHEFRDHVRLIPHDTIKHVSVLKRFFWVWILRDLLEMHATTKITQFLFLPNKKEKP